MNHTMHETSGRSPNGALTACLVMMLLIGIAARLCFLTWADPWGPHHADETVLPLEAIALWEGITPREVGWPAVPTRLALSTVSAAEWLTERGVWSWRHRDNPAAVLAGISDWLGTRFSDPGPLMAGARAVSCLTGVLALVIASVGLRRWTGLYGTIAGTAVFALCPLAVFFSQLALADVTGVFFATAVVALAARPSARSIFAMTALAAFAAASKYHFGIWLVTPMLAIWLCLAESVLVKTKLTVIGLALFGVVLIGLVPWFWLNPLLAIKELGGVVGVKVVGAAAHPLRTAVSMVGGTGILGSTGLLVGLGALLSGRGDRRYLLVLIPVVLAIAALAGSGIVFDRYSLVLLPGIAVIAALGWDSVARGQLNNMRVAGLVVFLLVVAISLVELYASQRNVRTVNLDVLAGRWVLAHVTPGASVAVYDEQVAVIPRTAEQLRACVARAESADAYSEKWKIVGLSAPSSTESEPMRSMLLNDEQFFAFWCARELRHRQAAEGYRVLLYHDGPRFWALDEQTVLQEFRTQSRETTGGVDVLVVNRPLDGLGNPQAILRSKEGQRIIYARPGLALR